MVVLRRAENIGDTGGGGGGVGGDRGASCSNGVDIGGVEKDRIHW